MSLSSKIVLGVVCAASFGTILFVHFKEWLDKEKLHEGVIRDVERQQKRKVENLYFLQQQIEMNKLLKKQQTHDEEIALKLLQDSQKSEG